MKPEAQRIVIAEACGWILFPGDEKLMSFNQWRHESGDFRPLREPPDYLNDLNAMHEAEKVLTRHQDVFQSQQQNYLMQLRSVAKRADDRETLMWECVHATAPQRAEAFLRTIGKWIE